jgi:hypothetical protein
MYTTQLFNNQNSAGLTTINDTCTELSYAVKNEKNEIQVEELAIFFITNEKFGCAKYEQSYFISTFMEKNSTSGFLYLRIGPKTDILKMMNQFMLQEALHQYNPESEVFELPMVVTDYRAFYRQINQSIQNNNLVKVINLL